MNSTDSFLTPALILSPSSLARSLIPSRPSSPQNFCPRIKELSTFKGPAEKCREIRPGHVLRSVDGTQVTDLAHAHALISSSEQRTPLGFRDMERYGAKRKR